MTELRGAMPKKLKNPIDTYPEKCYITCAALKGPKRTACSALRARPEKREDIPVKHAVIVTGGKQYRVAEGDVIYVEKLDAEAGSTVTFDKVLCVVDDANATVGTPVVAGATVTAKVEKNGKSAKVRVYKMKPKKGYRRTQGHRQPYTKVQIEAINA